MTIILATKRTKKEIDKLKTKMSKHLKTTIERNSNQKYELHLHLYVLIKPERGDY